MTDGRNLFSLAPRKIEVNVKHVLTINDKAGRDPFFSRREIVISIFGMAPWAAIGLLLGGEMWLALRRHISLSGWQSLSQIGTTVGLFAALSWWQGGRIDVIVPSFFIVTAVPLAGIDLRARALPNRLVVATYVITGVAFLTFAIVDREPGSLLRALTGALILLAFYGVLYGVFPGQLGGGDVKLAGISGAVMAWHSWSSVVAGLLLIWLFSAVVQLLIMIFRGLKYNEQIPHGPFIVIGSVAAILMMR